MSAQILEIKKQNAIEAFNSADAKGKVMLTRLFGAKNLYDKITDRVKTFEDACEVVAPSEDLKAMLNYTGTDPDMISAQAYAKLIIIIRTLNEGWVPDWSDDDQPKYMPWFKHQSGFGLVYVDYGSWYTHSIVGSRLCFRSSQLAEYAGKQFADIYNAYLSIKP